MKLDPSLKHHWQFKSFVLILAVAGAVVDAVHSGKSDRLFENLMLAFTFAVVVFIIDAIYDQHKLNRTASDHLKKLVDVTHDLDHKFGSQAYDLSVFKSIIEMDGPLAHVLKKTHEDLGETLKIDSKATFILANPSFALTSYARFWEALAEVQISRKKNKQPGLNVLTIHRCSISTWNDDSLKLAFLKMTQFCNNGGSIKRILCGRDEQPNDEYRQVAQKMQKAGVSVTYYDMSKEVQGIDPVWDFLVVEETGEAVIWESVDSENNVKKAKFTREGNIQQGGREGNIRPGGLVEMWKRIAEHTTEI